MFVAETDSLSDEEMIQHRIRVYADPRKGIAESSYLSVYSRVLEGRGRGRLDIRVFFRGERDHISLVGVQRVVTRVYHIVPEDYFSRDIATQSAILRELSTRVQNNDWIDFSWADAADAA